ncbi:MAG: DUF4249 domain-containing protein [Bacteroidia bacterium]
MFYAKYLFPALLLLLISSACQRLVELDLQGQSQMVVSCFLSPEQAEISVSVSQNQIVGATGGLSPEDFIVKDAIVQILNLSQGQTLNLNFDPSQGLYLIPSPDDFLQAQDSFQLLIQHPTLPEVIGRCQIPSAPLQFQIQLDSVTNDSPFPDFFCQTTWQDPQDKRNYYRLIGKIIPDTTFIRREPWFFRWQGTTGNADYLEDTDFDGEVAIGPSGDLQNVASQLSAVRPPRMSGDSLTVSLLHIDQSYYRYMRDLRQARNVDLAFSEPYTIYTNLKGGIGVFAAYHAEEKRLRIR